MREILEIAKVMVQPTTNLLEMCENAIGTIYQPTQIFNDGNKRAAVIVANHFMITKGHCLLVIPQKHVPEFMRLLVAYCEDQDNGKIAKFMRCLCWRTF